MSKLSGFLDVHLKHDLAENPHTAQWRLSATVANCFFFSSNFYLYMSGVDVVCAVSGKKNGFLMEEMDVAENYGQFN